MSTILWYRTFQNRNISLVQGDITEENVEAIVNAANSYLSHGGGVAAAIVKKGGAIIQEESYKVAPVAVGCCGVTTAGKLPSRYVIHAVGPVWGEGDEDNKLRNAILSSLAMANELKLKSISFPAISSGIYGFPKDRCAQIFYKTLIDYLNRNLTSSVMEIRICLYDSPTVDIFLEEFAKLSEN